MTNASIKNTFSVLSVFAIAVALSLGVFAIVAHAQDDGSYYDTSTPVGDNAGYTDYSGGTGSYYDTSTPVDTGSYYDTSTPVDTGSYYDTSSPYDTGSYYDTSTPVDLGYTDYAPTDVYGNTTTDVSGVGYSYNANYASSNYTSGYSTPSYSTPSVSQPFSFSAPQTSYSNPVVYQQAQQQQQQQQIRTVSAPGNTSTSNYCTGNSCNYTDNSNNSVNISNSGNTSNVTTVQPVRSGSAQYAVQYVYPQQSYTNYQYQTYNNVSCYISSSGSYLSWAASGATSAWLSGVGTVSPTGSMAVSSTGGTYTLTVSGPGGSNTCSTYVSGVNYNTSVSLSQIPYTGFDFGPFGNALYWLSLLAFAGAGAYLLVYYRGGMAFVTSSMLARKTSAVANAPAAIVKKTAQKIENALAEPSPLANLPVMPAALATLDSMTVTHSKNGSAPRIIITRS